MAKKAASASKRNNKRNGRSKKYSKEEIERAIEIQAALDDPDMRGLLKILRRTSGRR